MDDGRFSLTVTSCSIPEGQYEVLVGSPSPDPAPGEQARLWGSQWPRRCLCVGEHVCSPEPVRLRLIRGGKA